jgi:hypothetical protein
MANVQTYEMVATLVHLTQDLHVLYGYTTFFNYTTFQETFQENGK